MIPATTPGLLATQWIESRPDGTSQLKGSQRSSCPPPHLTDGETEPLSELVTEPQLQYRFHFPFIYSLNTRHERLPSLKEGETDLKTVAVEAVTVIQRSVDFHPIQYFSTPAPCFARRIFNKFLERQCLSGLQRSTSFGMANPWNLGCLFPFPGHSRHHKQITNALPAEPK